MKFWNKMKKNTKGFTLVEIIVVLVILAVLAAFTIPTMLGFVNESKGKAMIAEAREVYVAAQATATEYTAKGDVVKVGSTSSSTGTEVYTAGDLDSEAVEAATSAGASMTMQNYLKTDYSISDQTTAALANSTDKKEAFWTVTVSDGKVTAVNENINPPAVLGRIGRTEV